MSINHTRYNTLLVFYFVTFSFKQEVLYRQRSSGQVKQWTQVYVSLHSLCLSIFIGCSASNISNPRFRAIHFHCRRKSYHQYVRTSMHSVGLEPKRLILVGTRTIYQATGDAGY